MALCFLDRSHSPSPLDMPTLACNPPMRLGCPPSSLLHRLTLCNSAVLQPPASTSREPYRPTGPPSLYHVSSPAPRPDPPCQFSPFPLPIAPNGYMKRVPSAPPPFFPRTTKCPPKHLWVAAAPCLSDVSIASVNESCNVRQNLAAPPLPPHLLGESRHFTIFFTQASM
jgi:hypothetical protein